MLAITIVLFVVPHNQQIVTIRQLFTCRIPLFRNQNLNIQESRRQSLNSAAPYQTIRALLRHTAYQCELHFRKDLNVVIRLI